MEDWEKEFVPYELALRMKTLGFAEPCWCYFENNVFFDSRFLKDYDYFEVMSKKYSTYTLAPTFSQAFRWFRDNYDLHVEIARDKENSKLYVFFITNSDDIYPVSMDFSDGRLYEEAELECLKKLIEIVKQK